MAMQLQNNKMYILHRLFSNRTSEFEYTKDEFLDFFEIMVKNTGNRIVYFQRMTEKFLIIDYAQQPVKIRNIIIFLLVNTICGDILGVLR